MVTGIIHLTTGTYDTSILFYGIFVNTKYIVMFGTSPALDSFWVPQMAIVLYENLILGVHRAQA